MTDEYDDSGDDKDNDNNDGDNKYKDFIIRIHRMWKTTFADISTNTAVVRRTSSGLQNHMIIFSGYVGRKISKTPYIDNGNLT